MIETRPRWGIKEVAAVLILRIMVVFIIARVILPLFAPAPQDILSILDRLILIVLTLAFVMRFGTLEDLGLNFRPLGKNILIGLVGGVGLLGLSGAVRYIFVSVLAADINSNPLVAMAAAAATPLQLLSPLLIAGLIAPIAEEIYYRGFALPAFIERWGVVAGVIASGLFFSAVHLSTLWFVEIALVGMGLAALYYWTGSLLPGIIAHGFVNTTRLIIVYLS
ncbi:CPBP family intramembrane glutamic endopeptidase [Desulfofalx alkaliphila]|uniref:CPBP family intramembrane glutamic endopeptidase n=1 Tax=Desulfofalx alkaliphila TaxID=105483 RepID=UPI0004E2673A|nr:type II CAAX endopeptidase family protein [Desulfofalx alkaliphila]